MNCKARIESGEKLAEMMRKHQDECSLFSNDNEICKCAESTIKQIIN